MKLVINGEAREFEGPLTLAGLIEQLGMKQDRVAVELNRDIVQRGQWAQRSLAAGDSLEIVHFVGGGSEQDAGHDLSGLEKLSPHRTHESNWLMSLLCKCGAHGWYRLESGSPSPSPAISLCRWCPKVKVDGVVQR